MKLSHDGWINLFSLIVIIGFLITIYFMPGDVLDEMVKITTPIGLK